ncbi:MAG: hypothetical protein LBL67_01680 [Coriobacteriales bacterium]|jgi:hypothetical protein|nr:hypothetical protein [Coriobacteriales bacterium]
MYKHGLHSKNEANHSSEFSIILANLCYVLVLAGLAVLLYHLFYGQVFYNNVSKRFPSDTPFYVLGKDQTPRLISWLLPLLYQGGSGAPRIAVVLTAFVLLTCVGVRLLVRELLNKDTAHAMKAKDVWLEVTFSLIPLFMASIYLPVIYPYFYSVAWSGYPLHSPTYLLMVLAGVFTIWLFLKIYRLYFNASARRLLPYYIGLAFTLLISAAAKPNFSMVFLPMLLIVALYQIFFGHVNLSRGKRFYRSLPFILVVLPTLAYYLLLALSLRGTVSGQMAFGISGLFFTGNVFLKIVLALVFPLVVSVLHFRQIRHEMPFFLTWGMFIVGCVIFLCFYQTGPQYDSRNFEWGLLCGLVFVNVYNVSLLIKDWKKIGPEHQISLAKPILETVLLAFHLVCGLAWFWIYLHGGPGWSV